MIVYAGAIVVLFLFVIMLLGVDKAEDLPVEPFPMQRPLAVVVGGGLAGLLVAAIVPARDSDRRGHAARHRPATPTSGSSPATCSATMSSRSSSSRSC